MNDIKILTIPFDTTTGLFEDEALTGYLRGREVIDAQPQFFTHQNRPYWSICIVSRKYRGGGVDSTCQPVKNDTSLPKDTPERVAFARLVKELDEIEAMRYQTLLDWRKEVAHDDGVPPYIILTNRQCLDTARGAPRTLEGLTQVKGIGKKKVQKYGRQILEVMHGPIARADGAEAVRRMDGNNQVADGPDGAVSQTGASQSVAKNREPDAGGTGGDNRGGVPEEPQESAEANRRKTGKAESADEALP